MSQIGGYVTPDECKEFARYAMEFRLSSSSLAKLLIERELRCKRLEGLKQHILAGAAMPRARITAQKPPQDLKAAFLARIKEVELLPDQAASIIFRAELQERWLEKSVGGQALESS